MAVACGINFTALVTQEDGEVFASFGEVFASGTCRFDRRVGSVHLGDAHPLLTACVGRCDVFHGTSILMMAAGRFYVAAVGADGSLYTWGRDSSGELGHGDLQHLPTPTRLDKELFGRSHYGAHCSRQPAKFGPLAVEKTENWVTEAL
mmetsp:Transcript_1036/g.1324  ORF Transcript_1036/g.1324 Transcript_1036/m.1324 type:complete len:148 (-) Transcript_1036:1182-1625(-)